MRADVDDALVYVGLALHGPVDMTLTVLIWPAEANPFVRMMGLVPWLGLKTAVLVAFYVVYVWRIRPDGEEHRLAMITFAALGAAVMLMNLVSLYHS